MTGIQDPLAQLGEEARGLARDVPGPLRRVRLSSGTAEVEIEWQTPDVPAVRAERQPAPAAAEPAAPAEAAETADGHLITSPMVGTFYRAESEGAEPFVAVGDVVEAGQTVGLVEAMKLFNPIAAECSGVVIEVLAGNAEPVQFGDPLVRLSPTPTEPVGG